MIALESPWVLFLLPLPWFFRRLLRPACPRAGPSLRLPLALGCGLKGLGWQREDRLGYRLALGILAWIALVLAAAGPYWAGKPVALPIAGRDLVLAVDLSASMGQQDEELDGRPVSRFQVVQATASSFIERRVGDRVGLILFGSRAYLQTPLTFDRQAVVEILKEAAIGLAGRETAIGDAIGLAVKHLRSQPEGERVLILLTDGANNAGVLDPFEAAGLAAESGVKIYTIGIGGGRLAGLRTGRSDDFDPETLRQIADRTGGRYFAARGQQGLKEVYAELDRLEPSARESRLYRPRRALFFWPGSLALALSVLIALDVLRPFRPACGGS